MVVTTAIRTMIVNRAGVIRPRSRRTFKRTNSIKPTYGLYCQTIARIERERSVGNVGLAERLLQECKEWLRGWEWRYLRRLRFGPARSLSVAPQTYQLAVSADGHR